MSEEIGKHKGAVETLLHEKKELSRLLKIVNGQLQRHLKALEEAGIDTDQFIQNIQQGQKQQQQKPDRQPSQQREKQQPEQDTDDLLESNDKDFEDRDFSPDR